MELFVDVEVKQGLLMAELVIVLHRWTEVEKGPKDQDFPVHREQDRPR